MASLKLSLAQQLTAFAGGADGVAATGPHYRILVSEVWASGDEITLTAIVNNVQYDLGSKDITQADITFVTSFRNQVMLCAGDRVYFSGLDEPTGWENRHAGYGYLTISGERGEALEAVALSPYAGKLAIFARNNIQLWLPNADPTQWQLVQSLENVGTCSPKSVVSYGELDVFFLSDSGLRSLRAREFTDLVNVQDVGTPIDRTIQTALAALSEASKVSSVFGYFDSGTGRYMLFLGSSIYVFSYFPATKVAGWTVFSLDFTPSNIAVAWEGKLHLYDTTDNSLYFYPSSCTSNTATIIIPFFDAKSPASRKLFTAIDIAGKGTWKLEVGNDSSSDSTFTEVVAALPLSTFKYDRIPLGLYGTHLMLRLTHTEAAEAILGSVVLHWEPADAS